MSTQDMSAALIAELREAIDLDGFGCACEPKIQCGTCKARDVLRKVIGPIVAKYAAREALAAAPQAQEVAASDANDWLESEEFYNAMQGYRCAPRDDQREVVAHFENVKRHIRAALASQAGKE